MKVHDITIYAVYLTIFLIMGFVPYIGFINIGIIKITFMTLPVIIATIHLGFKGAIFSGLAFGLVSFFNAFILGSNILAIIGTPKWILVAIVSRIILGILVGLIILLLRKARTPFFIQILIITISVLLLNHVLFLGTYSLLASKSFLIIFTLVNINIAIEWPIIIFISISSNNLMKFLFEKYNKAEGF